MATCCKLAQFEGVRGEVNVYATLQVVGNMLLMALGWVLVSHWLSKRWKFFELEYALNEFKQTSFWILTLPLMGLMLMVLTDDSFFEAYVTMALYSFGMDFWDTLLFHRENFD